MSQPTFQFRLSQLLIATGVIAVLLTAITLDQSLYQIYGLQAIAYGVLSLPLVLALAACLFFKRLRLPALIVIVAVCATLGWHASVLHRRLDNLNAEVARIVDYVEKCRSDHGQFPADLSDYSYERPGLRRFIEYGPSPGGDSYAIWYNPTGEMSYGYYYISDYGYGFKSD